jgi:hypothetical protein
MDVRDVYAAREFAFGWDRSVMVAGTNFLVP